MKKLILLSMSFCYLSLFTNAQDTLFTGDITTSKFSRMDIIDWAMGETLTNGYYVNFGTAEAPAFTEVGANPVKTGINTSDKALHMATTKGHSWWPDFMIMTLAEPISITEATRYLHIYHYRENLNKGFSIYIGNVTLPEDVDKGNKRWDMDLKKPGVWEDCVVDLHWYIENATPVDAIGMLMDRNWGGDAEDPTNYYMDEIVLNNSNLPRGLNIFAETELSIDLGNEASTNKWVGTTDLQNPENTSAIVANPFTSYSVEAPYNTIMKFNKSANADWWAGGPRFVLNGSLHVGTTGNSYLHVFVNIDSMETAKDYYVVQLNAKDFAGNQLDSGDGLKYWSDDAGHWVDMVMDVTSLTYVSEFQVRFDVRKDDADAYIKSPYGKFYLDGLEINGSSEPRLFGPNAVDNKELPKISVYSANKNIVVDGNVSTVEVFSVLGSKIGKYTTQESTTRIPVNNGGVYLVRTTQTDNTISTTKVLVK